MITAVAVRLHHQSLSRHHHHFLDTDNSHERGNDEKHQFGIMVQSISSLEIEEVASEDSRLINDWDPREPCSVNIVAKTFLIDAFRDGTYRRC